MELQEFTTTVSDLFAYFQTKQPQQRFIALWWEEVKFIPGGEPLAWIRKRMQENSDRLPRNVAKAFREGWAAYKAAHPEAIVKRQFERCSCKQCGGTGFLFYRDEGHVSRVVRCAACENWRSADIGEATLPAMYASDLAARGYSIQPTGGSR